MFDNETTKSTFSLEFSLRFSIMEARIGDFWELESNGWKAKLANELSSLVPLDSAKEAFVLSNIPLCFTVDDFKKEIEFLNLNDRKIKVTEEMMVNYGCCLLFLEENEREFVDNYFKSLSVRGNFLVMNSLKELFGRDK